MSRNSSCEALVLATRIQGENNRSVTLLTPDEGIVYTTLFGGPKSKLRAMVSPFNRGKIWLYTDETKHSSKITDFDVSHYHLSFRENLFKSWAANFAAEIVTKTKCAGSPADCWFLINGLLDGMELTEEAAARLGLVRFIWRYLGLLGIRPQTRLCPACGKSFMSGPLTEKSFLAAYEAGENAFVCDECTDVYSRPFVLGRAALTYLEAVSDLSPREVRTITVDSKTMIEMKELCFYLIENACGSKLKALESGMDIL